jgi:hypothetical protein
MSSSSPYIPHSKKHIKMSTLEVVSIISAIASVASAIALIITARAALTYPPPVRRIEVCSPLYTKDE